MDELNAIYSNLAAKGRNPLLLQRILKQLDPQFSPDMWATNTNLRAEANRPRAAAPLERPPQAPRTGGGAQVVDMSPGFEQHPGYAGFDRINPYMLSEDNPLRRKLENVRRGQRKGYLRNAALERDLSQEWQAEMAKAGRPYIQELEGHYVERGPEGSQVLVGPPAPMDYGKTPEGYAKGLEKDLVLERIKGEYGLEEEKIKNIARGKPDADSMAKIYSSISDRYADSLGADPGATQEQIKQEFESAIQQIQDHFGGGSMEGLGGDKDKVDPEMPSPVEHKGRILRDNQTGKRYRSDGTQWVEIQ